MNWINYLNGSQHVTNHFTGFAGTETRGQLDFVSRLTAVCPVDVIARGTLAMFAYEATAVPATIRIPVLVIAGRQDKLTKREASEYLAAQIPGAQLVILEPCGHVGALERNAQMIEAVDGFGKKVATEPPLRRSSQ